MRLAEQFQGLVRWNGGAQLRRPGPDVGPEALGTLWRRRRTPPALRGAAPWACCKVGVLQGGRVARWACRKVGVSQGGRVAEWVRCRVALLLRARKWARWVASCAAATKNGTKSVATGREAGLAGRFLRRSNRNRPPKGSPRARRSLATDTRKRALRPRCCHQAPSIKHREVDPYQPAGRSPTARWRPTTAEQPWGQRSEPAASRPALSSAGRAQRPRRAAPGPMRVR